MVNKTLTETKMEPISCNHCTNDDTRLMSIVLIGKEYIVIECVNCSKMMSVKIANCPSQLIERYKALYGV